MLVERDHLAVEDRGVEREPPQHLDHLRHAVGHVGEVPRVGAHLVALHVHLQPRAVELPLDRRLAEAFERSRDVRRRLREHRLDRLQQRQPERREPFAARRQRRGGDVSEVAGQHQRPPHLAGRDAGRLRERVGHQCLQRPLPQLAGQQPCEELLLRLGRARQQAV